MSFATRKNQSGGSAMSGGADYQAEAYALVSAKIMAEETLNWAQAGWDRIPIFVRMETGSGGDDLLISLRNGNMVEVQAKKGLQRGQELWDALMALAHAVHKKANTYGVLLTNTDASGTVRKELKTGIERISANFDKDDELPNIVQEFVSRLKADNIDPQAVCKRLFVRVCDFESGSQDENATFLALRQVIAQPGQVDAARSVLVSDGMDIMTLRGGRDAADLAKLLQQNGIALSHSAQNMLVVREAYLLWCVERNAKFIIPSLPLALPMEKAWVRLRTMGEKSSASGGASLEEQIRSYHEWHRLADMSARHDSIAVEMAARVHRLLVVVAGPGAGKSTLLRRLVRTWAQEGKVLLHVSLRHVSQQMSRGITFENALRDTALDGFGCDSASRSHVLQTANYLLADGLDETDPYREEIARHLHDWALADERRHVIVTTRPVGHNPAWFVDWEHVELLPLDEHDVWKFAHTVLTQLPPSANANSPLSSHNLMEGLRQSQAVRLASRNPLLLGFLIALYVQGGDLDVNRYRLFAEILDRIGRQSRSDRVYHQQMNEAEARRAVDSLGWLLMERPTILEAELILELGRLLADSFGRNQFQGEQKARQALDFWEERGLFEAVGAGTQRTYTFVYMTFQEFAAARFLEHLPQSEFTCWVEQHYAHPRYRETLLLTGGTHKAEATIETLLNADIPNDPVSTAAFLAAETLSEMENPPAALLQGVIEQLAQRLTSQVPMIAYEAGARLLPLATTVPELLGPLALRLANHEQKWTREVACALGLQTGLEYVVEEALVAIYPTIGHTAITDKLLVQGAEYLLQENPSPYHTEIVKYTYSLANHSSKVHGELEAKLLKCISQAEFDAIPPYYEHQAVAMAKMGFGDVESWRKYYQWQSSMLDHEKIERADREAWKALFESLIEASNLIRSVHHSYYQASPMGTLAVVYQTLDIGNSPLSEIYDLSKRNFETELIEVLRGVLLVTALEPIQVQAETLQILNKLDTPYYSIYQDIQETVEFSNGRDIDWSLAASGELDMEVLFRALSQPSYFVCRFAAYLLCNCFTNALARRLFLDALETDSRHILFIISQIAKEIWGEEAAELVYARLEKNVSPNCAPLVKELGSIYDASFLDRTIPILREALSSTDVEMVKAGLSAMQELSLNTALHDTIQERYLWWFRDCPQDSDSVADTLLAYLITQNSVTETELVEAAKARNFEVRRVAIRELCHRMQADDALASKILADVFNRNLPLELLDTLSQSHPDVCKKHFERIAAFLETDNLQMQKSGIRALGDGWAEYSLAEQKLRPLFRSKDISLRDVAVGALRRLQTQKAMNE
jgi:hypothetical protein